MAGLDYDDILLRYKAAREATIPVSHKLIEQLSDAQFTEGARRLGILGKGGVMRFDTEDEMGILADFCLHCVLKNGRNTVEQTLADPVGFDAHELPFIEHLSRARFTVLIATQDIEPGVGLYCLDAVTRSPEPLFLAESLFSQTAAHGSVLAGRIFPVDEFYMTTGAGLPVIGKDVIAPVLKFIDGFHKAAPQLLQGIVDRKTDALISEKILNFLLRKHMATRIAYGSFNEDPNELMKNLEERAGMTEEPAPYPEPRRAQKIGPNELCPCGSGKKFKKCCGRRG